MKFGTLGLVVFGFFSANIVAFSQGCSDAGFCTLGSLKPDEVLVERDKVSALTVGLGIGKADHDVNILSPAVSWQHHWQSKFSTEVKLTALSQKNTLASNFGLSDAFLLLNYKAHSDWSVSGGIKLPLSKTKNSSLATSLPMDFQSSLGTTDLLLGAMYSKNRWQFSLGYQAPLKQNDNTFLALAGHFEDYQSTNGYIRKADVLVRLNYLAINQAKWKVNTSLLPIYHLANDTYVNDKGITSSIDGSQGLTLNANVYVDYNFSDATALQLVLGSPLVVRDIRPDGLTRAFVATVNFIKKW